MAKTTLTIGELAKQGNVATSLLRYYEKEGLLVHHGQGQVALDVADFINRQRDAQALGVVQP